MLIHSACLKLMMLLYNWAQFDIMTVCLLFIIKVMANYSIQVTGYSEKVYISLVN